MFRTSSYEPYLAGVSNTMLTTRSFEPRRLLLLVCLITGACGGGDAKGQIRFDHLEIGQHSSYAVLIGADYASRTSSPFEYVSGVLVADVVDRDERGFRVREAFASPDEVDARVHDQLDASAVYEYYLSVQDGTLRVLPVAEQLQSRLFPTRDIASLPLREIADPVVQIFGWKTSQPYNEDYTEAAIIDGELLGVSYPHLNAVIDDTPMQTDGPGTTWLYSATVGVVRSTHYSWWTLTGTGFDLQPE